MLYYLPVYYVSIQFGIGVFLKARLILTLVSILMHVVVARQFLSLGVGLFLRNLRASFFAAASMAFFLFWINRLNFFNAQIWMHVLFNVLMGLCFYSLFSFKEWPFVKQIVMSLLNNKKET